MSEQGWLAPEDFSTACAALPLVSVDLYIVRPGVAGPELLLGLRRNRPAQDWWFTPGGRIRKNESIGRALARVAVEEVGLAPDLLEQAKLLGAWDHFYPDSAFDPAVSTHYVNLAFALPVSHDVAISLAPSADRESQHSAWRWMDLGWAASSREVHDNVKTVVPELCGTKQSNPLTRHQTRRFV